jgi:hypothetical protein
LAGGRKSIIFGEGDGIFSGPIYRPLLVGEKKIEFMGVALTG